MAAKKTAKKSPVRGGTASGRSARITAASGLKARRFNRIGILIITAVIAVMGAVYVFISSAATTAYPMHTNVVATTFWVGENFQDTGDGSQVCSAYDSSWAMRWAPNDTEGNQGRLNQPRSGCNGAPIGGCDGIPGGISGGQLRCATERRSASNDYFPSWTTSSRTPRENPFYLDLPYDDINEPYGNYTGRATRCQDIPWRNNPGYAGRCNDYRFSYMKNRWVKIINPVNNRVCYGQIQDAGPADEANGSPHYDDRAYVFGSNDARPLNKSYGQAGMDVSPALNSCLGFRDLEGISDRVNWQFVEAQDVPQGPWTVKITTSQVHGRVMNENDANDRAYLDSIRRVNNGSNPPQPQPNANPTVTGVSSPQNGQTITLGSSITLSATATDRDGSVAKIDLFDDASPSTSIGSIQSGANLTYTPPTVGTHRFTAIATDNLGAVSARSSQSVTVTVQAPTPPPPANVKPTVSLSSRQNNQTLDWPATISLSAAGKDTDGSISRIVLYRGNEVIASQSNLSRGTLDYTDTSAGIGTHTYYAVAFDNNNAQSDRSNQIRVTVRKGTITNPPVNDTTPPSTITGLTPSLTFNWGYKLNFRWNPSRDDSGSVSYLVTHTDSSGVKAVTSNSYSFSVNSVKTYNFQVQAIDPSGNKTAIAQTSVTPKCFLIWCTL